MDKETKTLEVPVNDIAGENVIQPLLATPVEKSFNIINGIVYPSMESYEGGGSGNNIELPDVEIYVIRPNSSGNIFNLTAPNKVMPGRRYTIINESENSQRINYIYSGLNGTPGTTYYELGPYRTVEFILTEGLSGDYGWSLLRMVNDTVVPKGNLYQVWRFLMDTTDWNNLGNPLYVPQNISGTSSVDITCYGLMYSREVPFAHLTPFLGITKGQAGQYEFNFLSNPLPEVCTAYCQSLGEGFGTFHSGAIGATIEKLDHRPTTGDVINIKLSDDASPNKSSFDLYIFDLTQY